MPRDNNDDRPKKSWREIDQAREKGQGTRREPGADRTSSSQAYRSYKTQLNKLFDGGALPEALQNKLGDSSVASTAKERKTLAAAIVAAVAPKDIAAALKKYEAACGFPQEEDVLGKLLDLSNETIVLKAIETLAALREGGTLKRGASLKGRLKAAAMTIDDPTVQDAARQLLAKL